MELYDVLSIIAFAFASIVLGVTHPKTQFTRLLKQKGWTYDAVNLVKFLISITPMAILILFRVFGKL